MSKKGNNKNLEKKITAGLIVALSSGPASAALTPNITTDKVENIAQVSFDGRKLNFTKSAVESALKIKNGKSYLLTFKEKVAGSILLDEIEQMRLSSEKNVVIRSLTKDKSSLALIEELVDKEMANFDTFAGSKIAPVIFITNER